MEEKEEIYEVYKPKKKAKSSTKTTKKTTKTAKKDEKKPQPTPVKMVSFDMWFRSLGKPEHHKAGMKAYAKTKGKKSKEAWDRLFKNYFKSY